MKVTNAHEEIRGFPAVQLFGQDKTVLDEGREGVLGLNNPGSFAIGDNYVGKRRALPPTHVLPELFAYLRNTDTGNTSSSRASPNS